VRNKRPCYFEDARISLKRAFGQLWKLTVITGRKIGLYLADLIFGDMKIVDQPFGRRGNGALIRYRGCNDTIGFKKRLIVVANPFRKRPPFSRL